MNGDLFLWIGLPFAGLLLLLLALFLVMRREIQTARARELFRLRHEHLEALFLEKAAASGLPRGLRWVACTFDPEVVFARERSRLHRRIVALVAVTVQFEAVEGGDMEGLPAVPQPRHGSAVLTFERHEWTTAGRVLFNLTPAQVLEHFAAEYEPLRRRS
jgi:hypothetical protein